MPEPRARFELEVSHARAIAEAVQEVRGVAALDGGSFGSVSLYLPGAVSYTHLTLPTTPYV